MKKFLFFIGLLSSILSFGQNIRPLFRTTADSAYLGSAVEVKGEGYYMTGHLNNAFTNHFIQGGNISNEEILSAYEKLEEKERAGAESRLQLNVLLPFQAFGQPHWAWMFTASDEQHFSAQYHRDLFGHVFRGNAPYAGDTLTLLPVQFNTMRFQKLGAGIYHRDNNSSITLSYVKGEQLDQINLDKFSIYSDPGGDLIWADAEGSRYRSDTSGKGPQMFAGHGFSLDMVIYLNAGKNRSARSKNTFRLSLENLGMIFWNNSSIYTPIDTSLQFTGVEVSDILGESVNNPFEGFTDSLNKKTQTGRFTQSLPIIFSAAKIIDPLSNQMIQGFYGFRLKSHSAYRPLVYAGLDVNIKSQHVGAALVYGGYSGLRMALDMQFRLGKNIQLGIGSSNVNGWVSDQSFGKDLYSTLIVKW